MHVPTNLSTKFVSTVQVRISSHSYILVFLARNGSLKNVLNSRSTYVEF